MTSPRFPGFGLIVSIADPELVRQVFAGDPATKHAGESSARVLEPTVGRYSGRLLAPGSIVAFDDIVEWEDVKRVFERVQSEAGWLDLGQDGRLGILQRTAELSSG